MKDLKEYYQGNYTELVESLEAIRKSILSLTPFSKNQERLVKKIKNARQRLAKIFDHQEIVGLCRKCHEDSVGCCCQTSEDIIPKWRDVIYILANNPNFKLPKPDIKFLKSVSNYCLACGFLGKEGCLLKENRPAACLYFYCFDLSLLLEKLSLKEKVSTNKKIITRSSVELIQEIIVSQRKNPKAKSLPNSVGIYYFILKFLF